MKSHEIRKKFPNPVLKEGAIYPLSKIFKSILTIDHVGINEGSNLILLLSLHPFGVPRSTSVEFTPDESHLLLTRRERIELCVSLRDVDRHPDVVVMVLELEPW